MSWDIVGMALTGVIGITAVFAFGFAFGAKATMKEIEIELKKRNGNN